MSLLQIVPDKFFSVHQHGDVIGYDLSAIGVKQVQIKYNLFKSEIPVCISANVEIRKLQKVGERLIAVEGKQVYH